MKPKKSIPLQQLTVLHPVIFLQCTLPFNFTVILEDAKLKNNITIKFVLNELPMCGNYTINDSL